MQRNITGVLILSIILINCTCCHSLQSFLSEPPTDEEYTNPDNKSNSSDIDATDTTTETSATSTKAHVQLPVVTICIAGLFFSSKFMVLTRKRTHVMKHRL